MNSTNPKVDFFFNKTGRWQEEFEKLRTIQSTKLFELQDFITAAK